MADPTDEPDDPDLNGDDQGDARRPAVPDDRRGDRIITASWIGTGLYTVAAVLTMVSLEAFQVLLVVVTVSLFVLGMVAFVVAYLIAVARSREDLIGMGGLFFLSGTAPKRVQRHLMASFAVEIAIATVTASIGLASGSSDATNPQAFGFLTPLFGLGLAGLWGARFGVFASRPVGTSRGGSSTG